MKFDDGSCVRFEPACETAELDEQWSYVGNKAKQRWLWLAIDNAIGVFLHMFSGKERMHDIVIGLLINCLEFGVDIYVCKTTHLTHYRNGHIQFYQSRSLVNQTGSGKHFLLLQAWQRSPPNTFFRPLSSTPEK